jgi:hypothetical protein
MEKKRDCVAGWLEQEMMAAMSRARMYKDMTKCPVANNMISFQKMHTVFPVGVQRVSMKSGPFDIPKKNLRSAQ